MVLCAHDLMKVDPDIRAQCTVIAVASGPGTVGIDL